MHVQHQSRSSAGTYHVACSVNAVESMLVLQAAAYSDVGHVVLRHILRDQTGNYTHERIFIFTRAMLVT
jgi:hypothetical protein